MNTETALKEKRRQQMRPAIEASVRKNKAQARAFAQSVKAELTALAASERSFTDIARRLNEKGIKTRRGALWTTTGVIRAFKLLDLELARPW